MAVAVLMRPASAPQVAVAEQVLLVEMPPKMVPTEPPALAAQAHQALFRVRLLPMQAVEVVQLKAEVAVLAAPVVAVQVVPLALVVV